MTSSCIMQWKQNFLTIFLKIIMEEHMEKQKNVGTSGKLLRHLGSTTQNHQNCKQLPCCQLQCCYYCPVQEQSNLCKMKTGRASLAYSQHSGNGMLNCWKTVCWSHPQTTNSIKYSFSLGTCIEIWKWQRKRCCCYLLWLDSA